MNKRNFLLLPISLTFIACSGEAPIQHPACANDPGPEPACEGDPKNPKVTINTTTWVFTPRCVNASKSSAKPIVFRLVPTADNSLGSTAIRAKESKDTWLTGVNSPDPSEIVITVPDSDWVTLGDHKYGVFKSNGDCFDPRVHIVP